jgi:hypothetical protein
MRKALYSSLVVFSFAIIFASGCSKDNGGGGGGGASVDCATVTNKAFAADISPITQTICAVAGCHAAGSTNGPGPLTKDPYRGFFRRNATRKYTVCSTKKFHYLLD